MLALAVFLPFFLAAFFALFRVDEAWPSSEWASSPEGAPPAEASLAGISAAAEAALRDDRRFFLERPPDVPEAPSADALPSSGGRSDGSPALSRFALFFVERAFVERAFVERAFVERAFVERAFGEAVAESLGAEAPPTPAPKAASSRPSSKSEVEGAGES